MGGANSSLKKAEHNLLHAGLSWHAQWRKQHETKKRESDVRIETRDIDIGDGMHIHTVEYFSANHVDEKQPPLVCMHGFATGIGIYYAALPSLAERWGGRVIAIDTLGCGLSSRPRWKLGHGTACKVEDAEDFFLDGLEKWRDAMKLDTMVLMGHSLGGYLSVAYADRYPDHVNRLVLVSAVGTPEPPARLVEAQDNAPFPFNLVLGMWSSGWSPFTVAKAGFANMMLGAYVKARFSDASWVDKPLLKQYFVDNWTGENNSAGAYAHATLLRPGGQGELAYARTPMGPRRIPGLAVARISAIYGDHDWMDWRHMAQVRRSIEDGGKAAPAIEILHVADAGHNVQVDNPLGFVDAVVATGKGGRGADGQLFGRQYHKEDRQWLQVASPRI